MRPSGPAQVISLCPTRLSLHLRTTVRSLLNCRPVGSRLRESACTPRRKRRPFRRMPLLSTWSFISTCTKSKCNRRTATGRELCDPFSCKWIARGAFFRPTTGPFTLISMQSHTNAAYGRASPIPVRFVSHRMPNSSVLLSATSPRAVSVQSTCPSRCIFAIPRSLVQKRSDSYLLFEIDDSVRQTRQVPINGVHSIGRCNTI